MEDYYDYYCDVHTAQWQQEQQQLADAIAGAKSQITESNALLNDPDIIMSPEHEQQLTDKISELQALIAQPVTASATAIKQKTTELKTLTDNLSSIYSTPEPTTSPSPTPTVTPTTTPAG